MRRHATVFRLALIAATYITLSAVVPQAAEAHCDTMDGPVIADAKVALEKGDVTPTLKWIKYDHEAQIREVFRKTLAVRNQSAAAKELADTYFFETLVRLHRAGEGAPYSGLKPAGTASDTAIAATDKALASGRADELVKLVVDTTTAGIQERFAEAVERSKHADDSVEAGRKYVEAYVELVHYIERLHTDAEGHAPHAMEAAAL